MTQVSVKEFSARIKRLVDLFPDYVHVLKLDYMGPGHEQWLRSNFSKYKLQSALLYCYPRDEAPHLFYDVRVFYEQPEEINLSDWCGGICVIPEDAPIDIHSFIETGVSEIQRQIFLALYGPSWVSMQIYVGKGKNRKYITVRKIKL